MKTLHTGDPALAVAQTQSSLTGSHRRTLEAIFRHPAAHNLEWSDVVGLIGAIGETHKQSNDKFVLEVAGKRHLMRKPHTKDLTSDEVIDLRHFLMQAGSLPDHPCRAAAWNETTIPSQINGIDVAAKLRKCCLERELAWFAAVELRISPLHVAATLAQIMAKPGYRDPPGRRI